jgi:hypothetical protein
MQLQYQVDSYLNPDLCTARDWVIILIIRSFQFNALSRRMQRPNSPYRKVLLDTFAGLIIHHWSPETPSPCWLLLGYSLLNYKLLHIDILQAIHCYSTRRSTHKAAVSTLYHLTIIRAHHRVLLWTWISILLFSNLLTISLSVNASYILRSNPNIFFGIRL